MSEMFGFLMVVLVIHGIGFLVVSFISVLDLSFHSKDSGSDSSAWSRNYDRKGRIKAYQWLKWSLLWEVPVFRRLVGMVSMTRQDIVDVENEELQRAMETVRREIAKKNEEELREFDRQLYGDGYSQKWRV